MPLVGTGIMPSGAAATELTAVTRRAFVPKCIVQIYKARALLSALLANAQTASGGISSVTVPVQGTAMTIAQATDFSGVFTAPASQQGITEADFNLKAVVVPIGFNGFEGLVQLNAAVIPLIEARMNDAGNQAADYLSTQLFTNATDATINIDGLPLMAGTGTYGNIAGATNTWWQANVQSVAGAPAPHRPPPDPGILPAPADALLADPVDHLRRGLQRRRDAELRDLRAGDVGLSRAGFRGPGNLLHHAGLVVRSVRAGRARRVHRAHGRGRADLPGSRLPGGALLLPQHALYLLLHSRGGGLRVHGLRLDAAEHAARLRRRDRRGAGVDLREAEERDVGFFLCESLDLAMHEPLALAPRVGDHR